MKEWRKRNREGIEANEIMNWLLGTPGAQSHYSLLKNQVEYLSKLSHWRTGKRGTYLQLQHPLLYLPPHFLVAPGGLSNLPRVQIKEEDSRTCA